MKGPSQWFRMVPYELCVIARMATYMKCTNTRGHLESICKWGVCVCVCVYKHIKQFLNKLNQGEIVYSTWVTYCKQIHSLPAPKSKSYCVLFSIDWIQGKTRGHTYFWIDNTEYVSLVAHIVKSLPAVWESQVWSLDQQDPLEKEMVNQSSILARKIPWTEEPRRLESTELQRVGHNWATLHLV